MRLKRLKLCVVLLLGIGLTGLQAQESVNASGGKATGSSGSTDYSVGQVVYHTHIGANGSVAEGVHQPYEISEVTGIDEAKGITLSVVAYPNPTSDYLVLEVENYDFSNLQYRLFDVNGKLLQSGKITGTRTNIAMGRLVPAVYFVKIVDGYKELKIFKIIKN